MAAAMGSGNTAIAAGFSHTVILRGDGSVWSVGDNNAGQLGCGKQTRGYTRTPAPMADVMGTANTAVAAGYDFTLVLLTLPAHVPGRGNVRCFRADLGEGAGTPDEVAGRLGDAAAASSGEVCLIGL